jgi:anti-sigma B factor antagonist
VEAELPLDGQERSASATGVPAVVVLPAEIDFANAEEAGQQLAAALASGAGTVIADMSATVFCDSPGARMIIQAYERAEKKRITLRFVVTSSAVHRVFQIMDYDRLLPIYPSVDAAMTGGASGPR